jgi:ATP-dependent exoDNAse (exonuclease V) beta subunit
MDSAGIAVMLLAVTRLVLVVSNHFSYFLAVAGAGKTSTMIGGAGFLVESAQCQPNQILMLAFANKAAAEMQERLDERIDEKGTGFALAIFVTPCVEYRYSKVKPQGLWYRLQAAINLKKCNEFSQARRAGWPRPNVC